MGSASKVAPSNFSKEPHTATLLNPVGTGGCGGRGAGAGAGAGAGVSGSGDGMVEGATHAPQPLRRRLFLFAATGTEHTHLLVLAASQDAAVVSQVLFLFLFC